MSRSPIRIAVCVALACTASQCASAPASGAPPARAAPLAAPSVEVEIGEASARPLTLILPIAERGASKVEARAGSTFYRVSLVREGPPDDGPLRFEITRNDSQGDGRSDVRVAVAVRIVKGARVILARLARPDGTTTTITAALQ